MLLDDEDDADDDEEEEEELDELLDGEWMFWVICFLIDFLSSYFLSDFTLNEFDLFWVMFNSPACDPRFETTLIHDCDLFFCIPRLPDFWCLSTDVIFITFDSLLLLESLDITSSSSLTIPSGNEI